MNTFLLRILPPLTLGCLGLVVMIFTGTQFSDLAAWRVDGAHVQSFKIMLLSLILEAFPFILLGVLFSSVIQVFVSDDMIRRFTPRHAVLGVLFGSLLGILFPLCECGMIPVVRRLIRKGMPAYIGIVFILAGPIINPVVYTATFAAFRSRPEIVYTRMGLAFVVSVMIGLLLYRFMKNNPLREPRAAVSAHALHQAHSHDHAHGPSGKPGNRLRSMLSHASDEFFEMGKYLIFGAILTALIHTGLSREVLIGIGDHPWFAHVFMMGFAFILSICSTSDAFVAASFAGTFGGGSLLAFLVFGPMIDLKTTLMLLSAFKTKIVLWVIALCFVLVLAGSIVTERLFFN
ncbi:permease [Paenibacillus sp. 1P07SE]|uniref:permease n=1 Tax=Paenibacillus sp. 1P07SE TaxID=3132209 RepID=UPI0039A77E7A